MKIDSKPIRIGLTGGIASGKTTAQKAFESYGVPCIDHDKIAREVVSANSLGLQRLVDHFGQSILTIDRELDRSALKKIIFNNSDAKKTVESIIHPLVFQQSEVTMALHQTAPYILIVSPLLIESGSAKDMYKLIVVDVPEEIQLQRLLQRDGMSEELAKSIIKSQTTRKMRHESADYILDNSATLHKLNIAVEKCHLDILKNLQSTEGHRKI